MQLVEGLDRTELLRSVGVEPSAAPDPTLMVADGHYYSMLEQIFDEDPRGHELSMRAGGSMRCDEYGAFGLAMKSAPTLRGTYSRAERFSRILTNVTRYELEETEDLGYVHLHRDGKRRRGLCMSNEASLAALLTIAREVTGLALRPERVYFKHSAPPDTSPLERFFGAPVVFGTDRDALSYRSEALDTQNLLGDPTIAKFFDTHLEAELAKLQDAHALDKRVRIQVSQVLSDGIPKISDIARRLGMSGRTLQRRLADSSLSYQTLVDEARRELAKRLLRETDYALAEISFLTGFSVQSAFTRAFKRWAGQTPRSYRLSLKG